MARLKTLVIAWIAFSLLLVSMPAAKAVDVRVVDVASVTWSGAKSTVGIAAVEAAIKNEVGPRWKRYTTIEGSKEDKSISFQFGTSLSDPISLTRPMQCEGSAAYSFMNS
ncbi:MAG: hypothetical protein ACO3QM_06525, partial [Candidatus Nanopelagicaceae bacterium]